MMKQIGDQPAVRSVQRTIPQICFAARTEPFKLPNGLRNIILLYEAINLKVDTEARAITYAHWYQTLLVGPTMSEISRYLSLPIEAVATSLGLGWNPDIPLSEFDLTDHQALKLMETLPK